MSLTKVSYSMINGESVNANDYGAVGDGTTDDTAAVQSAIDYCLADPYNPKTLVISGQCYITESLMIDDGLSPVTLRNNRFKIVGSGSNGGFYTDQAIVMFSSNEDHSVQSVFRGLQFDNLNFEADNASAYVMDGFSIQVQFNKCLFNSIKCMATTGVNTFSYWFRGCEIQNWEGMFFELLYTSGNDILFEGCYFNGNLADSGAIRISLVQGFRCVGCTFETMDGTPITLRGSRSCDISGNYFEACALSSTYYVDLNESGSAELSGVNLSGNLFYMSDAQVADASVYGVNWDSYTAGNSSGNWCTGKLHSLTNAQPGNDLSIAGDVESTTGDKADRAPIRSFRWFDEVRGNLVRCSPLDSAPSPSEGDIYYDNVTKKHYGHNGTGWNALY